jgi:hypothetical protein
VLDAELLAFIRTAVRSTWTLELLLLMREQRSQAFAIDDLVLSLRATPTLMKGCLAQLEAAGLTVHENATWRYAPSSAVLDKLAGDLAAEYAERPVGVVNAIMAQPNDRLKNFADAFKFPKKKDD